MARVDCENTENSRKDWPFVFIKVGSILWQEFQKQREFVLAHSFDDEAFVVREEK